MSNLTVREEIDRLRETWGKRLLILGHHYQDSDVVACCDAVGDSLELSRLAAASGAGCQTLRPQDFPSASRMRMSAVSAIKRTPQKMMRSASEAAAKRESSKESPTASQQATTSES